MKSRILFVLRLLTGLVVINAGLNKFFYYMPVPKDLPEKAIKAGTTFMEIGWLMPLVGSAEIVGGILFILPKTRALGAIILLPVLTGVLLANINMMPSALPMVFIIIAVLVWTIIENKEKYLPMIRK